MNAMEILEVLDGGMLTTVQDLGRYGYQRYGVPVSGAADTFALRVANRIAGNEETAAALEATLIGPRLRVLAATVMALAGADLSARLDGIPLPLWEPFAAPAGAVLSFGDARDGVRGYLAVHGGVDVPLVLGSRSTTVTLKLGGLDGRPLGAGDRIAVPGDRVASPIEARRLARECLPSYGHRHVLRVVLGPQAGAFTANGIRTLTTSSYTVSARSDRVGCRLEGPAIEHAGRPDIVSDGSPNGAVQVAGDGMPIVLLADRGTTGGYAKIATVIGVDLPCLAQAGADDTVTFRPVTVEEAHACAREQRQVLDRLAAGPAVTFAARRMVAAVDGTSVEVDGGFVETTEVPDGRRLPPRPTRLAVRVHGPADTRTFSVDVRDADQ